MKSFKLTGTVPALALAGSLAVAPAAQASPISVNFSPSGTVSEPAPSFNWQGFSFALENQPSGADTAAHDVVGSETGELDFFLKNPGKVTYKAAIPEAQQFTAGQIFTIGTKYGEDLSGPTDGFSFVQPFLRNLDVGNPNTAASLLSGSDAGNPASPFTGVQLRQSDQGSGNFDNNAFADNVTFGEESLYTLTVGPDGMTDASVSILGDSASLSLDLTPGNDDPFAFTELLLQVGSFQDGDSFETQFGEAGQQFTFTQADVAPVPLPAALPLLLVGFGGLGLVARRKRKAA